MLWKLEGKRIAVWGLAFKANTDDLRDAPALDLVGRLAREGAEVVAYDPVAMEGARSRLPAASLAPGPYEAARGANAVVVCTEWEEFKQVDLVRLRDVMAEPVIMDGRNLLDREAATAAGFIYASVGRPTSYPSRALQRAASRADGAPASALPL